MAKKSYMSKKYAKLASQTNLPTETPKTCMKRIFTLALGATFALAAFAEQGHISLLGVDYTVDTLFHAKVGPGTTQTQLRLEGPSPLNVFYLTVDRTTPNVTIRAVSGTDKVAGTSRTSVMAQTKSKDGLLYFAGTNGDFYWTSGTATNGTSKVGTPTHSFVVENEPFLTFNGGCQFIYDNDGLPHVQYVNYYTGTAECGDKTTSFKGINDPASVADGLTLYTSRFWGSTNQNDHAGNCYEVTAKLADGETFIAGGKFRIVVTSEANTDGDTPIPADGFVLHGRGGTSQGNTGAADFVKGLKPGDVITLDNIILDEGGQRLYPRTVISGSSKNVGLGETITIEDAARHPRTCLGYTKDRKQVIMMVVDGRTSASAGISIPALGDVMRYAGAYEAVNIDGGGSSTLYTQALGIRNHCSDGSERSVSNGIFAVLEAPEDNEIAELQFSDWKVEIPSLAVYTPVVYAYNKYGKLINADYKDYSLECPAGLGEIINDGHSLMSSEASTSGVLTVTSANGIKASVNVFLTGVKDIRAKYETVVLNKTRKWDAELVTTYVGNTTMPLAARTMSWTSEDASVATVTPEGLVTPVANGETVITGVRGEITVNINVKVQIAGSEVAPADRLMRVADWKTTNIGMASVSLTPNENGTNVDYVIKSPRGARISVLPEADIFSHPQSVRVRLNPGTAKVADVTITLKANNAIGVVSKKFTDVKADETNVYEMPVADYFDVSDIGIYPIRFVSVAMGIGGKTKTDYHVEIPGIEAVYDESTLSVNDIKADDNDNADSRFFNIDGDTVTVSAPADIVIVDAAGRTIAAYSGVTAVTLPKGVAVVSATTADGVVHALKVVR